MTRRLQVTHGAVVHDVEVRADGHVEVDGTAFAVTPVGPGRFVVTTAEGGRDVVVIAGDATTPWVGAQGVSAELVVRSPSDVRLARTAASAADMTAPMPSKVVSIPAPAGTAVAAGDPVVVLEAMKMTLTIRAPRDGVVKVVRCQPGELVKAGSVLAELEG